MLRNVIKVKTGGNISQENDKEDRRKEGKGKTSLSVSRQKKGGKQYVTFPFPLIYLYCRVWIPDHQEGIYLFKLKLFINIVLAS